MKRSPVEMVDINRSPQNVAAAEAQRAASGREFPRGEKVMFSVAGGEEVGGTVTRCERNELLKVTVVTIARPGGEVHRIEASRVRKARGRAEVARC